MARAAASGAEGGLCPGSAQHQRTAFQASCHFRRLFGGPAVPSFQSWLLELLFRSWEGQETGNRQRTEAGTQLALCGQGSGLLSCRRSQSGPSPSKCRRGRAGLVLLVRFQDPATNTQKVREQGRMRVGPQRKMTRRDVSPKESFGTVLAPKVHNRELEPKLTRHQELRVRTCAVAGGFRGPART